MLTQPTPWQQRQQAFEALLPHERDVPFALSQTIRAVDITTRADQCQPSYPVRGLPDHFRGDKSTH
jgi:hypothetical protein